MNKGARLGLIFGLLGAAVGLGAGVFALVAVFRASGPAAARAEARASLDPRCADAGYAILATEAAAAKYAAAIGEAKALHPGARELTFRPDRLDAVLAAFREKPARHAMVFILPSELDVNLAWAWLAMTTRVDDDPFVDVRTGFITGESPEAALAFVRRIARAARGEVRLPGAMVDNLGPNPQAPEGSCAVTPGSFMIPVYAERFGVKTISHGLEGFTAPRLAEMEGAGVVHYGGHGYPDRVVDSLNGPYARRIRWAPCVFFNGACYCGVVHGWFDTSSGRAKKKTVPATASFCLNLLSSEVLGYLASLHPDHGIPVYQEMEFLAWSGAPLGEVIKHTHDGVVLGAGGRLPALTALADGAKPPFGSPAEVMLWGTASRVLYGDPAMRPLEAFTAEPFEVSSRLNGRTLAVRAVLKNPALKSTFTETYHSDLSATGQFNDRALVSCDLPADVAGAKVIAGLRAEAGGAELKCRLVGFGVEADDGRRRLHALVDLPSTGYQQGPFRAAGAALSFEAEME